MLQALRCHVTLHCCTSTHFHEKQSKANIHFQISGRFERVPAEEKLPMRWRDCRHLCDAMPCSPWSADTENSLSLLLSLLHTGRIENRGRGVELNPNIPPESSASCTEVKALCAPEKIKKKQKHSNFLLPNRSVYLSFVPSSL